MSSLGRSVLALVARRTPLPTPAPSRYLASSFATSSKVRLDSTPTPLPSSSSATESSPLDAASAQALDNALNPRSRDRPAPPPSTSLPTSNQTQSRQPVQKSKFRIPRPATPSMGVGMGMGMNAYTDESLFTLTVTATRNNTSLTFADITGPLFPTISGGTDKTFKNSQRASYEAAHQATLKMFEKMEEYSKSTGQSPVQPPAGRVFTPSYQYMGNTSGIGSRRVKVVFVGLRGGQGREAVANAISGQEGDGIRAFIGRVEDRTGVKIGGTRGKKRRRL